jgi:hypothetical protein
MHADGVVRSEHGPHINLIGCLPGVSSVSDHLLGRRKQVPSELG